MRPLRVESIELKNVGPFSDFKLELAPVARDDIAEVHILTGPNGSGKSTLLSACFETIFNVKNGWLARRMHPKCGISTIKVGDEEFTSSNVPKEPFDLSGVIKEMAHSARGLSSSIDRAAGRELPVNNQVFYYATDRTVSVSTVDRNGLPSLPDYTEEQDVASRVLLEWIVSSFTRAALAESDGATLEAQVYRHNIKQVARLLSEIASMPLEFSIDRVSLAVRLGIGEHATAVALLPDGLKSMLAWIGDLIRRIERPTDHAVSIFSRPFILMLDELDIHLHPAWQRRVLPALQRAFPAAQFIVSTHSPFVIGSISDAWVYRLDPTQGRCDPIPSGAGESIATILEDVFGVPEMFDSETHALFREFYSARQRVLEGEDITMIEQIAGKLSARGEEVQDIVSRELAQLKRLTAKRIGHAQV